MPRAREGGLAPPLDPTEILWNKLIYAAVGEVLIGADSAGCRSSKSSVAALMHEVVAVWNVRFWRADDSDDDGRMTPKYKKLEDDTEDECRMTDCRLGPG